MNLCLGTVQFGMDYGIQGQGKPSKDEVFTILDYAYRHGIKCLDSASGYGEAQTLIGEYFQNRNDRFQIISKLPYNVFDHVDQRDYKKYAEKTLNDSLLSLRLNQVQGLLFHNASYLYDEYAMEALHALKDMGLTAKIGVSVYSPEDGEYAIRRGLDIIQIPCNIFDRRFDELLNEENTNQDIYVRSIFLQGLLLMDVEKVGKKLPIAEKEIFKLQKICEQYHFTRREVAMNYIKNKKGIHSVIFGVDNMAQLNENLKAFYQDIDPVIINTIACEFGDIKEEVVSPLKWR